MGFQTQIFNTLAAGIEGEYADDSPRRDTGCTLLAKTTAGAAAEGALTFTANPSNGHTVTIANVTYAFKTTLAAANDIKIGADLAATLASLAAAVNGTGTAGTDYYAGTKNLADIMEAEASSTALVLTMLNDGIEGNYTALASSNANAAVTAFTGGADASEVLPQFACAFTHTASSGQCQIGGTGVFAGILVNPKMHVNYQNLKANMTLPSGSQGSLCTFGHIFIKPASSFAPGYAAAYNNANGVINAYSAAANIPAGFTQIANAQFIQNSGNGGELAILQLGN